MGWFSTPKPEPVPPLRIAVTVLPCAKCGAQGHIDFPAFHVGPRGGGQALPPGARPETVLTLKGPLRCACCGAERQIKEAFHGPL
jgi:hypothetical protein